MWAFLVRPECILCVSSAFLVLAQLRYNLPPRINQTHLTPFHLKDRTEGLKVKGSNFTLGGFPFLIVAGTVHYFRVPRAYWRDRLLKLKAGGFNTVTTHVPWNLHEPMKGRFSFTRNLDLMSFMLTATNVDLWVILCPGPYVGGDLDLGGLPSWLLRDAKMRLRTTYKGFTKAVNKYFDELIPRIAPFQFHKGGPLIAVQLENEYGSYHKDKKYMHYIKQALVKRKIQVLFLTADEGQNVIKGHLKNVLATLHMKHISKETYENLFKFQGLSPIMMTVYTASSFDRWGVVRQTLDLHMTMKEVHEMVNSQFSLNFYMFHGGTNFDFIGGAIYSPHYTPMVTSYDYGALLTEDGDYTPEYFAFQEYFSSVLVVPRDLQPEIEHKAAYRSVKPSHYLPLWDILPHMNKPFHSDKPICMEELPVNQDSGQSTGYTLYETSISTGGILNSRDHIKDRAQVFLDQNYIGVLDCSNDELTLPLKNGYKNYWTLSILVENQGRVAYGLDINKERKGITGNLYLNNSPLRKFKIFSLDMKAKFIQRDLPNKWKAVHNNVLGPAFFLGYLRIGHTTRDTFIKLEGWKKGVIFINGQNLGRYWEVGPQETLYLPGPWLQPGKNEIIIFEEFKAGPDIQFTNISNLVIDTRKMGHLYAVKPNSVCFNFLTRCAKDLRQETGAGGHSHLPRAAPSLCLRYQVLCTRPTAPGHFERQRTEVQRRAARVSQAPRGCRRRGRYSCTRDLLSTPRNMSSLTFLR
ncbi:PREDICTED: beta-galactosidase-1-like protein 2-like [Elephantulus edwardii]|uniref:beta-galactosidase-1-like protein 2-like n=1 Tax=Elephantulus edwardii TaxID=28737 RepID=UPI0003F087D9|nr:PREDICTED: beta-galactosidase-1-like protein 2-like [Elephantulus edwardii]